MLADVVRQEAVADAGRPFDADPSPGGERLAKVVRPGGFDPDDAGLWEPVGDRDGLAGHQPAAADRADEVGDASPLPLQVADDLQGTDAVAGDHVGVVVRGRLDGPLPLGDLPRQPVPFAGLVVAGDVVGADFRAEGPRPFELHPRRGFPA